MTNTRIVQLCQTKKPERCGRLATAFSKVRSAYVCDRCADPDALTGGAEVLSGASEVLTPVVAKSGDGWGLVGTHAGEIRKEMGW